MEPTNERNMEEEKKPEHFEKLMAFLDAETYGEKLDILQLMQPDMNDYLIDTMAVCLDVVIPEGDIDGRFRQLKSCLEAKQKYETSRFR